MEVIPAEIDLEAEQEEEEDTEEPEEAPISETPFDDSTAEFYRQEKFRRAERKEFDQMSLEEKIQFARERGYVPPPDSTPQVTAEQEQAIIQNAYETDFLALADRYSPTLLTEFRKDFRLGKIRIPADQHLVPNAMEDIFLKWLGRSRAWSQMSHIEQRNLIKAAEGPALRSRSADVVHPDRIRPKPKPKREKKYTMPQFSPEDLAEAVHDYVKKHPERFRGGKR